jgi:hypothetical protein
MTDHPSLRIGHAVHFMRLWRESALNAVVLIDPDFGSEEVALTCLTHLLLKYPHRLFSHTLHLNSV